MTITNIKLKDWRNYEGADVCLVGGVNVFSGDNAQGKTNLLEAIYYCARGRALRSCGDRDLIKFGTDEARIRVTIKGELGTDAIDARINRRCGKGIAINGQPIRKLSELLGALPVVAFTPEDLSIVKSGPSERRRYIDAELCQLSRTYCDVLARYHKALKQRNALLRNIQRGKSAEAELYGWNETLNEYGVKIMERRAAFIKRLSAAGEAAHSDVTGGAETLKLLYKPDVDADRYKEILEHSTKRDIALGATSRGAHKDDVSFEINGSSARLFGSQGQQRTAGLSAKLAEIDIIEEEKGVMPILLLDDVMSELDAARRSRLMERVGKTQTVITCADIGSVEVRSDKIFYINNGVVA